MTVLRTLALGVALALVATGAHAQTETVVVTRVEPAPPDAALARRSSLARELIGLSAGPNFAKEIERIIGAEIEKIGDGQSEEAAWVRAAMPPMMSRMVTRLLDEMVPAYAEIYSEEELRGQIDFYRSPVGRSVAAKTAPLAMAVQEAQVRVMADFMTELQGKYCARFNCGEAGQAGAKSRR